MTVEGDAGVGVASAAGPATAERGRAVAVRPENLSTCADHGTATVEAVDRVAPRFRLGNRPPLTGIRAFVIVSILIYHSNFTSGFTALPGAWAAISVFFVLSGFLITSMLMSEREQKGRISLRNFYSRRALRLLPPLALTVLLITIYALFVYVPYAHQRVWGDVEGAVFYYADFRSASGHEFFLGFMGQAWSLSIEEQFYVLWAVLLLAATLTRRRTAAYALSVTGIAASAAYGFSQLSAPHFTGAIANQVYYGFASRADALFVGCLLGLVASGGHLERIGRTGRRVVGAAALASAALLGWIVVEIAFGSRASLALWLPLSILLSAVLIVYFVTNPAGAGSRFVGLAPFVLVGNLAYTLYLVHWPVYVALNPLTTHWSFWPLEMVRMAIVFAVALASWYLMERPLMRWRRRRLA